MLLNSQVKLLIVKNNRYYSAKGLGQEAEG